jgi:ribosome-associated protein
MNTQHFQQRSTQVSDEPETPDEESAEPVIDRSFDTEVAAVRSRSDEAIAESRANAIVAAKIADEYRSKEIVILDLTGITPIVDFFVVATGATRRQMHAVAEEVDRVFEQTGSPRVGLEGYRESSWILQDYGDIVLHVFTDEMRKLYDLERLYADAPRVEWQEPKPNAAEQAPAEPTEPTE